MSDFLIKNWMAILSLIVSIATAGIYFLQSRHIKRQANFTKAQVVAAYKQIEVNRKLISDGRLERYCIEALDCLAEFLDFIDFWNNSSDKSFCNSRYQKRLSVKTILSYRAKRFLVTGKIHPEVKDYLSEKLFHLSSLENNFIYLLSFPYDSDSSINPSENAKSEIMNFIRRTSLKEEIEDQMNFYHNIIEEIIITENINEFNESSTML